MRLRPRDAKQRVKVELVIEAIKKAENIIATDEEIENAVAQYAEANGLTKEKLMETLTDSDKEYFADRACADKIVNLLVDTSVETDEELATEKAE